MMINTALLELNAFLINNKNCMNIMQNRSSAMINLYNVQNSVDLVVYIKITILKLVIKTCAKIKIIIMLINMMKMQRIVQKIVMIVYTFK